MMRKTLLAATAASVVVAGQTPSQALAASYTLDEGAGTVVRDSSGKGHHSTSQTAVASLWAPGVVCTGLDFSSQPGTGIQVPDHPSLRFTSGFTLEAWIKVKRGSKGRSAVSKHFGIAGSYNLYVDPAGLPSLEVTDVVNSRHHIFRVKGTTRVDDDAWHHVVGVWNLLQIQVFVDGKQVGVTAFPGPIAYGNGWFSIGHGGGSGEGSSGLLGRVDEVRAWDRAMTPPQVLASFHRFKTTKGTFTNYGTSCPGAKKTPKHVASGTPRILGTIKWELADTEPASIGLIWIGFRRVDIRLWDIQSQPCRLYSDIVLLFPLATDASGRASVRLPIPCLPRLAGAKLESQAAVVDWQVRAEVPIPLTNGVEITLGGTTR